MLSLARLDKINQMDEKPNDSVPDVPSRHEAKGEGSEGVPEDRDKRMMGPRRDSSKPGV